MAGTWRISIEAVEGLRITPPAGDSAKQARPDGAPASKTLVVEVGDGKSVQKTKPFEVSEDGNSRINRVLFVPAPAAGRQLAIRAVYAGKDEGDGLVGEAALPASFGIEQVELFRRQRRRCVFRVGISEGLPSPPPGAEPAQSPGATGSQARLQLPGAARGDRRQPGLQAPVTSSPALGGLTPASASPVAATPSRSGPAGGSSRPAAPTPTGSPLPPSVASSSADRIGAARERLGGRSPAPGPAAAANARPLRMRFPGLPFIGNCDVTIEGARLPQSMSQPFFIIGLEGQEFLAEDTTKCLKYTFQVGYVQSSVTLYCYDAKQTNKSPVGRVLLPLADVLWSAGAAPDVKRLRAGFEKEARHFQRQYTVQFLPPNEAGDSHTDPSFVDAFEPHLSQAVRDGPNKFGAFGEVSLSVEVTFRNEVSSLMGFYLASIVAGAKAGNRNGLHGGPVVPALPPSLEDVSSMNILESPALRSLLNFLWRFKHFSTRPSRGFGRFLREQQHRSYIAAASWFLFCMFGYFPCSAWVLPIYIWLALLGNGLLAAFQRQADWACKGGEAKQLFWSQPGADDRVPEDPNNKVKATFARTIEQLQEVEPMVRRGVLFLERVANLLSFADGPASVASFLILGGLLGTTSLSLFIISHVEGIYFLCGAYGALTLVLSARAQPAQLPPPQGRGPSPGAGQSSGASMQLFNQAFACVPDQAEIAHRFVASRVQAVDK